MQAHPIEAGTTHSCMVPLMPSTMNYAPTQGLTTTSVNVTQQGLRPTSCAAAARHASHVSTLDTDDTRAAF